MAGKTEYRLDEYREFKNGTWGPWRKLDEGKFYEEDRFEFLSHDTVGEMIINDYSTGKMDIWTARKLLKRELNTYRSNLEKPEFRCIREKLEQRYSGNIKQIEKYLEEIETILIQKATVGGETAGEGTVDSVSKGIDKIKNILGIDMVFF
jgi:hypothetical protein